MISECSTALVAVSCPSSALPIVHSITNAVNVECGIAEISIWQKHSRQMLGLRKL